MAVFVFGRSSRIAFILCEGIHGVELAEIDIIVHFSYGNRCGWQQLRHGANRHAVLDAEQFEGEQIQERG
jgi:hypothetical protein